MKLFIKLFVTMLRIVCMERKMDNKKWGMIELESPYKTSLLRVNDI